MAHLQLLAKYIIFSHILCITVVVLAENKTSPIVKFMDKDQPHNTSYNHTTKLVKKKEIIQSNVNCQLSSTDPYVYNKIQEILSFKVKLLEYHLLFPDYDVNPLNANCSWTYRGHKWARAYSQHGQTLLSLAFNYGVMSLMTLTLGVQSMEIPLTDSPKGCIAKQSEDQRIRTVMYLLMRDFRSNSANITIQDQERICHEVILKDGKYAKFTDRCCHIDAITKQLTCTTDIINIWLKILFFCLASVKFGLLFFGPIWFISLVESIVNEKFPYVVKLKDPLVKTIYLCNSVSEFNKTYDKVVDLRGKKGFPKLKECLKSVPIGEKVKVKFTRYDILVKYKRLLVENDVPVSVISNFIDAFCRCKIHRIGPFKECCQTDVCKSVYSIDKEVTWLRVCEQLSKVLLLFTLPFPFYLRLIVFYMFEADDIRQRTALLSSMNLEEAYNGAILAYLTPTHPLFIFIYVLYFVSAISLGLLARKSRKDAIKRTIIGSFRDLKYLKWMDSLGVFVGNMIWPFKRYGAIGCIIAPVYWIIVLPCSILVYAFYCLPSIYVAFRMMVHSPDPVKKTIKSSGMYRVERATDKSVFNFETEALLGNVYEESVLQKKKSYRKKCNLKLLEHILTSLLCILTMFGILLIMAECAGFVVELMVFTMMGVIVNAGAVLKYVTLLILVVVYSYDCYNNVGKKYLKLNKSLFNELKSRCKDIETVTSLPSHLQENYGFKSQELSEQADYEAPDDIHATKPNHWMLNDVVLFVDNNDMPRIPRDLFEEICEINVAGAPGPVYQSLIEATQQFLKIMVFIFFVFIVVLTFGQVYRVSSTNQMLATLAGGFLPFLMKMFLTPSKPDIELGTVSFKSKLDEIIKNFHQNWPIYDLPFELWTEEDEKKLHEGEDGETDGSNSESTSVKGDNNKVNNNNDKPEISPLNDVKDDNNILKLTDNGIIDFPDTAATKEVAPEFEVDILIYLPNAQKQNEKWLEVWSDFDELSYTDSIVGDFYDDVTRRESGETALEHVL